MLRRPIVFDVPAFILLPSEGTLWVRYTLGVFRHGPTADDLATAEDGAMLMSGGREVARVPLRRDWLAATQRVDYE